MTGFPDTFEDIVSCYGEWNAFDAAFQQARQAAFHTGESVEISEFGRRAWAQLNDRERAAALGGLFRAYFWQMREEENAMRLANADAQGKSYLQPSDETVLGDALAYPEPDRHGDETVTVPATCLTNVLAELALLRHRVAVLKDEESDE